MSRRSAVQEFGQLMDSPERRIPSWWRCRAGLVGFHHEHFNNGVRKLVSSGTTSTTAFIIKYQFIVRQMQRQHSMFQSPLLDDSSELIHVVK
jgi:hypothetical protein